MSSLVLQNRDVRVLFFFCFHRWLGGTVFSSPFGYRTRAVVLFTFITVAYSYATPLFKARQRSLTQTVTIEKMNRVV